MIIWKTMCGRSVVENTGSKQSTTATNHYLTIHYTIPVVVWSKFFRKQKFYGFQVRKPYRLFKTIVVSIITFFKRYSSIIRFLIVPNSIQLKLCVTDNNITVSKKVNWAFSVSQNYLQQGFCQRK